MGHVSWRAERQSNEPKVQGSSRILGAWQTSAADVPAYERGAWGKSDERNPHTEADEVIVLQYLARVAIVALICALATVVFGWMSLPVVGFIYSIIDRRARARGAIAALGAALGWLGILGAEAARGADVRMVAVEVGSVMQLPAFALVLVTLAFAAVLCGAAAVLGSRLERT